MEVSRSEMKKKANPITHAFNRESYFTKIGFRIDNKLVKVTSKIDTGATYTVIGLCGDEMEEFRSNILKSNMRGVAYDASGTELKLFGYIVENFKLTDDITLDKIKLFF